MKSWTTWWVVHVFMRRLVSSGLAHIKLDKRMGATIRQLGYPTKNSLKSWHEEYERSRDLRTGYVRPAKFSQVQKAIAVEHYLEHGHCIAATIRALG